MKTRFELGIEICPPPPPFTLPSKSGVHPGKSRLQTSEKFRNNICASQNPKQKPAYVNRQTRPPPPAYLPPSTPQPECGCYGTDTKLICLQNQRYLETARPASPSQCFHDCSFYNTETCSQGNRQRTILQTLKNPYENYCCDSDKDSVGSRASNAKSFHPSDSSGMYPNSTLRDDPSSLPAISPVVSARHDANKSKSPDKTYSSLLVAIQDLLSGSKDLRRNTFLDTETVLCEVVSHLRSHIQQKPQDTCNGQFKAQTYKDANFNELDLNGNYCTLDGFVIDDSEDIIIPPPPDFAGIPLSSSSNVLDKNSNKKAQELVPPSPSEWDSWNSDDDSLPVGEIPQEFQRLAQQFQQRKRIHSEYPIQQHLLNQSPEFQNCFDRNQQDSTTPSTCTRPDSDLDLCMRCRHSPISEGDSLPKEIPQVPCEASIYSALNYAFRHDSNPRQISGISPTFQAVGFAGKEDLTDEFPNSSFKINEIQEQKRAQSPYHVFYHFPHHPDFLRTDKDAIIPIQTKSQGNQVDGRHLCKNKTTQTSEPEVSLNQKKGQFQTKQTPPDHTHLHNQDFSHFAPYTSLFPSSSLEQAVQKLKMDASAHECKQSRLQEKDSNSLYLSTQNLQRQLKTSFHSSHNYFGKDEDGILETLRQAISELANRKSGAVIAATKCTNTSKNHPEAMVYPVKNFGLLDKNANPCHTENWDTAQPSSSESCTSVASSASCSSSSTQQQTAREQANLPGEKQAEILSGSDYEPRTGTNKPAIPVISANNPQVPVLIPSTSSQSSSASTRSSILQFPKYSTQAQLPLFPTYPSPYDSQFDRNHAMKRETSQLLEQFQAAALQESNTPFQFSSIQPKLFPSDFAKDSMKCKSTSKSSKTYPDFVKNSHCPCPSTPLPPDFQAQSYFHNHGPWPAPTHWLNGMTPCLICQPSFSAPSDKNTKQATGHPSFRETGGYPCFVSPQGFTEAWAQLPHHFIGINNKIDFKTPVSRVNPSAPPSRLPQNNDRVNNPGNFSFTGMKLPLKRRVTGQRKRN